LSVVQQQQQEQQGSSKPMVTDKTTMEPVVEQEDTQRNGGTKEYGHGSDNGTVNTDTTDNSTDTPDKKRSKTSSLLEQLLSPHILHNESEFRTQYASGKPYPHGQLMNLFRPEFIDSVKEEIKSQTRVKFKESDLFRVYQSIDLANLKEEPEQKEVAGKTELDAPAAEASSSSLSLPHVLQLRQVLYSQEWRSFMERLTGLPPSTLNHQIDSACNCHAPGCHLLCHDDVIGTRKISYILYLTEPDWIPNQEGGALELYPPQANDDNDNDNDKDDVEPLPAARIAPVFNSMAYFVVTPGVSFHAVQEVLGDRPRLSLQGWYHAAAPPDNMEQATLQQLKKRKNTTTTKRNDDDKNEEVTTTTTTTTRRLEKHFDWTVLDAEEKEPPKPSLGQETGNSHHWLGKEDRQFLSQYLQFVYLTEDSLNEIQQKFEEESSVQLCNFLLDKWVPTSLDDDTPKPTLYDDTYYTSGTCDEWKLKGPAHKQRYLQYQAPSAPPQPAKRAAATTTTTTTTTTARENETNDDDAISIPKHDVGRLLHHVQTHLFESPAFAKFLARITSLGKATGIQSSQIRRFRPGLDYTVAHYGLLVDTPVLDATMCFVQDETLEEKDTWHSGDAGGFECYIEADEEEEDEDDEDKKGVAPADQETSQEHGGSEDDEDNHHNNNNDSHPEDGKVNGDKKGNRKGTMAAPYATAPKSNGAADEYNEDDDTELLSVSASNNTLSLVFRDPGTMRFVKYVGYSAPSSRYDISLEYQIPLGEEDNDDDDEKEDDEQVNYKENEGQGTSGEEDGNPQD
jgi:prolyl 3-hydroxylase /prolyl 3,4-dihydroxylase